MYTIRRPVCSSWCETVDRKFLIYTTAVHSRTARWGLCDTGAAAASVGCCCCRSDGVAAHATSDRWIGWERRRRRREWATTTAAVPYSRAPSTDRPTTTTLRDHSVPLLCVFLRERTHTHIYTCTAHTRAHTHHTHTQCARWPAAAGRPRRPLYPVRLNSILKKPIISDKSALGFIINEIIHAHTHTHTVVPVTHAHSSVVTSVGQISIAHDAGVDEMYFFYFQIPRFPASAWSVPSSPEKPWSVTGLSFVALQQNGYSMF